MVFVPRIRCPRRTMAPTMRRTAREVLNGLRWREPNRLSEAAIFYRDRTRPEGFRLIRGSEIQELGRRYFIKGTIRLPYYKIDKIVCAGEALFERRVCAASRGRRIGASRVETFESSRVAANRRWMRRAWRGVNGPISGGLLATGPGEVRLRCGENCSENPDDAANRAGLASEIDQDDADHARHDGAIHQVLPRNRRGRPQSSTENDVDYNRRRDGRMHARRNSLVCRLDRIDCHRQDDRQDAAQHEEQLVRLLRAEFDHRLLSRVVALGHGFGDPRAIRSIWVPTLLTVGENQPAERGRAPLHFGLFRAFLEGVRVSLGRVAT